MPYYHAENQMLIHNLLHMLYLHCNFLFFLELTYHLELILYLNLEIDKFVPLRLDLDLLNNHLQLQYEHLFLLMHLKKLVKLLQVFCLLQFSFQQSFHCSKPVHQLIVHQNAVDPMYVNLLLLLVQMIQ